MKLSHLTMIALLGACVAAPSFAQPGPGMGGMGGMSPGKGPRFAFDKDNTPGWALMTSEERTAHRERMLAARSYDECKAIQGEHHTAMEARAKEKGATLPAPRQNGCDRMKARGLFK
jgi:hypothetical protein